VQKVVFCFFFFFLILKKEAGFSRLEKRKPDEKESFGFSFIRFRGDAGLVRHCGTCLFDYLENPGVFLSDFFEFDPACFFERPALD
jgi:hypothetical protein